MVTIVSIVGARPQFIKAAPVSRVLRGVQGVREVLVHTGQHYDSNMSTVFFDELGLPNPDFHLGIGSLPHGAQTGRMLEAVERVMVAERPDWVLVYGDTNSTLAGALSAAKLHVPIAHVEAGLRSFDRSMPEEVNRVVSDHLSDLLLAPTEVAVRNLEKEGATPDRIRLVGDVMYDAALYFGERARTESTVLARLGLTPKGYVLATVHRAENTDEGARLAVLTEALARVAQRMPVILPLHGRTRAAMEREGLWRATPPGIRLLEPVGYLDMTRLTMAASVVVTDSGGLQKEAFFNRVPCVTLRERTEWVELVALGWNRLAPPVDPDAVARTVLEALSSAPGSEATPYGHGDAAKMVARALLEGCGV
jgi:UDP-GlcNAc3NAcA epimerase